MSNRTKVFAGYVEVYGDQGPYFNSGDYIVDVWGRFRESKVNQRTGFYPAFFYFEKDAETPSEVRVDFTQYMDFKDMPEPHCRLKTAEEKSKQDYYNLDNKASLN